MDPMRASNPDRWMAPRALAGVIAAGLLLGGVAPVVLRSAAEVLTPAPAEAATTVSGSGTAAKPGAKAASPVATAKPAAGATASSPGATAKPAAGATASSPGATAKPAAAAKASPAAAKPVAHKVSASPRKDAGARA